VHVTLVDDCAGVASRTAGAKRGRGDRKRENVKLLECNLGDDPAEGCFSELRRWQQLEGRRHGARQTSGASRQACAQQRLIQTMGLL
jgi:hypothetical protein